MKGAWWLALRHAQRHPGQTLLLAGCIGVATLMPAATEVLVSRYEQDLGARAEATPLVSGARGNRFDLTLAALYFRRAPLRPMPRAQWSELNGSGLGIAVPLHLEFTARGVPVVGTSPEYFELRACRPASGSLPLRLGDVVLGAKAAEKLQLNVGDPLYSDPKEIYDIAKPAAIRLKVCGVLAPRNAPDDEVVFVDVKTAWLLDGRSHGHEAAEDRVSDDLILGRTEEHLVISQALIEDNEVDDRNLDNFHYHGDPDELPLSAILFWPRDDKAATLIKARINQSDLYQMERPSEVIGDLMAFVFRIKRFFDSYALLLLTAVSLLIGLVILLSTRLRAKERWTLYRMGGSRFLVWKLHLIEWGLIVIGGLGFAAVAILALILLLPNLVHFF